MDMDNLWIVLALRTLSKQIIVTVRVIQLLIILIIYHKEHSEFKMNVDSLTERVEVSTIDIYARCPATRGGLLK